MELRNKCRVVWISDSEQIIYYDENATGVTYVGVGHGGAEFDTVTDVQEFIADNGLKFPEVEL